MLPGQTPSPARPPDARHDVAVTVAICTFRRPEKALRAVQSVSPQLGPSDELLVVDNDPDAVGDWGRIRRAAPAARVLRERTPGLNFARNRALRECASDILLLLDDDAVAAPGWLDAVRGVFAGDPGVGVCTGRVEPLALDAPGPRIFEANGGFARGASRMELPPAGSARLHGARAPLIAWAVSVGSGNNFAVRRDLALSVGGFDEALDLGHYLPAGGDHDMLWRVLTSGWRVVYEPAALAWHEHRESPHATYEQINAHQRGLMAMLRKSVGSVSGRTRLGVLLFITWRLVKPLVRMVRRIGGRDPLPLSVLARMWIACWRGLFGYSAARREADRRRSAAHGA